MKPARQLTDEQRQLVIQYSYVVNVGYNRLWNNDELLPYREEIMSEGYAALCLASTYFDNTIIQNPYCYFLKAVINRMYTFVREFIWKSVPAISLDASVDDDLTLSDIIPDKTPAALIPNYIDDILKEFENQVLKDPALNDWHKKQRLNPKTMNRMKHILMLIAAGYDGEEIGIILGVSRQVVNVQLQRLKKVLEKSSYRIVD